MSNSEEPVFGGSLSQNVQFSQATARIPDRIRSGVYATGAIVITNQHEFLVDFVQQLSQPQQLVARVAIPPTLVPGFIKTISETIAGYTQRFGPPPALPQVQPESPRPPIQEFYDRLKVMDDVLCPAYCNNLVIAFAPADFCFDFVAGGFPRSVVTCRVLMASHHAPKLLESLTRSWEQRQQQHGS